MKVTLFWLIRHLMHGMSITNEPPYGCSPLKKSFIFLDLGLDIIGRKLFIPDPCRGDYTDAPDDQE